MSTHLPATPSATIISINAHPSRFPIGTFAHHRTLGWCEIMGLPSRRDRRNVRCQDLPIGNTPAEFSFSANAFEHQVDVADLQPLTEWREFRSSTEWHR